MVGFSTASSASEWSERAPPGTCPGFSTVSVAVAPRESTKSPVIAPAA